MLLCVHFQRRRNYSLINGIKETLHWDCLLIEDREVIGEGRDATVLDFRSFVQQKGVEIFCCAQSSTLTPNLG